jgi:hypothetical protein
MDLHIFHGMWEAAATTPGKLEEVLQKANHSRYTPNLGICCATPNTTSMTTSSKTTKGKAGSVPSH